jgi:hypothetical protein
MYFLEEPDLKPDSRLHSCVKLGMELRQLGMETGYGIETTGYGNERVSWNV